jgi:hypothetical protein
MKSLCCVNATNIPHIAIKAKLPLLLNPIFDEMVISFLIKGFGSVGKSMNAGYLAEATDEFLARQLLGDH